MKVTTPSGFSGEIRKLKGSEANILSDKKAARKGETYDKILRACWLQTEDVGPYGGKGVSSGVTSVQWSKILVCDRFVTLAAIRSATYGSKYIFSVQCGETGRGCGAQFEWEIDLEEQLPVFALPDESHAKIAAGDNRFETELDGKAIVFKLPMGADEKRAAKVLRKARSELFTTALATRIVEVEGMHRRAVTQWLDAMDLDVQLELLAKFEAVDGGFDTEIEIECPECDRVQKVTVPLEGEEYWLPRKHGRGKSDTTPGRKAQTMATLGKIPEKIPETPTTSDEAA